MIVLIDNYDSFTYNLVQRIGELDPKLVTRVYRNDKVTVERVEVTADDDQPNLLLIHVEYNDALSIADKKEVLGYRYYDIRNLLTEYNLPWNDSYLEGIPTGFLLAETIETIVSEIRNTIAPTEKAT